MARAEGREARSAFCGGAGQKGKRKKGARGDRLARASTTGSYPGSLPDSPPGAYREGENPSDKYRGGTDA